MNYDPNQPRDAEGQWTDAGDEIRAAASDKGKDKLENMFPDKLTDGDLELKKVSESELHFRDHKDTKNKFVAARTIYINSLEELDMNNVGVHFSKNLQYMHTGGGEKGVTDTNKLLKLRVITIADRNQLLSDAMKDSNENFKHELEVIFRPNTKIDVEIEISKNHGKLNYDTVNWVPLFKERYKGKVNTGNRYDSWIKEYL